MEESGWRGRYSERLMITGSKVQWLGIGGGHRWKVTHSRQTRNIIDGFLMVRRRTRLDKGRATDCPGLPRPEGFPGTRDLQTRISCSP